MKLLTTTLLALALTVATAAPALAQDASRDEAITRMEENAQVRKVLQRGIAAADRGMARLDEQGKHIGAATAGVGEVKVDVKDWKVRSNFDPLPWILGIAGIAIPAIGTPVVIARRARKKIAALASQVAAVGEPATDAGQPFRNEASEGNLRSAGGKGVRAAHDGGSGQQGNSGVMPAPDIPALAAEMSALDSIDFAEMVKQRALVRAGYDKASHSNGNGGNGNGSGAH